MPARVPTRNQLNTALARMRRGPQDPSTFGHRLSPREQLNEQIRRVGGSALRRTNDAFAGGGNRSRMRIERGNMTQSQFVDFQVSARRALTSLDSRDVGHRMLNEINQRADVRLAYGQPNRGTMNEPQGQAFRRGPAGPQGRGGVGTRIQWDPNNTSVNDQYRPAFIGLGHELVHAWRAAYGEAVQVPSRSALILSGLNKSKPREYKVQLANINEMNKRDEAETVGLMRGPRAMPTENLLRREHNIAPRTAYGDLIQGEDVSREW